VNTPERNQGRTAAAKREGYRHKPLPSGLFYTLDNVNEPRDEARHAATLRLAGLDATTEDNADGE
jgi:hypothetical protein